jgi:hypothetical protein
MGRKGKAQNHTAKELNAKAAAAKHAAGGAAGGAAGAALRLEKAGKSQIPCKICKVTQPTPTCMKTHYEAKHPKINYAEEEAFYQAAHEENKRLIMEMDGSKTSKKNTGGMTKKEREAEELRLRREKEAKAAEREARKKEKAADSLLTPEQRAMKQVKKGDALVEAGKLEEAVVLYRAALAMFGGKRPKLETKIAETLAAVQAEDEELEPEPAAVDASVEGDASVEVADEEC